VPSQTRRICSSLRPSIVRWSSANASSASRSSVILSLIGSSLEGLHLYPLRPRSWPIVKAVPSPVRSP
jgi:hypothetical protein